MDFHLIYIYFTSKWVKQKRWTQVIYLCRNKNVHCNTKVIHLIWRGSIIMEQMLLKYFFKNLHYSTRLNISILNINPEHTSRTLLLDTFILSFPAAHHTHYQSQLQWLKIISNWAPTFNSLKCSNKKKNILNVHSTSSSYASGTLQV